MKQNQRGSVFERIFYMKEKTRNKVVLFSWLCIMACIAVLMFYLRQPQLIACCGIIIFVSVSNVKLIKGQLYLQAFISIVSSLLFFLFICSACLEWKYGFFFYLFLLIPFSFLFVYTKYNYTKMMITSMATTAIVFISYLLCLKINEYYQPQTNQTDEFLNMIYLINLAFTLALVFLFISMLTMEVHLENIKLEKNKDSINIQKQDLENALAAENALTDILRILYSTSDIGIALNETLDRVGSFLLSERVYLYEIQKEKMYNIYEWCANGIKPLINHRQGLDIYLINRWQEVFSEKRCLVISDLRSIKDTNPVEYRIISAQNIKSCIVAPIFTNDRLTGFIGVDNAPLQKSKNIQSLLLALAYFLASVFEARTSKKLLEKLSYIDKMTSIGNRNAFQRDIQIHETNKQIYSVGIIYFDLNGLKKLNDTQGHSAGDKIIIGLSNMIVSVFEQDSAYRIGGDEFIVICTDISLAEFNHKVDSFLKRIKDIGEISVSVGSEWSEMNSDITTLINTADKKMYRMKKQYYSKNKHN